MMVNPLISVIVPTKNSAQHLFRCLYSIMNQTYRNIEIIVVDNFSTDETIEIAKEYSDLVYQIGPERSAQVNYGVEKASGTYVYKVDSDFVLSPCVIEECVRLTKSGYEAIVVHNTPDTSVSLLAKIRKFEVDMYKYDLTYSSARFVKKEIFLKIGGYNREITAGEDYDFQNRLNKEQVKTGFINAEALHLGEPDNLASHLKKILTYGIDFVNYRKYNKQESRIQLSPLRKPYLRNLRLLVKHPILTFLFISYTFLKFSCGAIGYLIGLYEVRLGRDHH